MDEAVVIPCTHCGLSFDATASEVEPDGDGNKYCTVRCRQQEHVKRVNKRPIRRMNGGMV